ncbi:hypothetical protein [Actinomadura rupiterrae]|uniref:hypothetical protein n=1 Tax=Actinomadura rupiterrae TaxID=559627 RepID=UPI0020A445FC|nr:hypothetical protein [Actinomadura rupiterrae]MCP2343206.1 hypothetical protein [Actinomadura rupiterrae]
MPFTSDQAARAAITVVRTHSVEAGKAASIHDSTAFTVDFLSTDEAPQQGLGEVSGWTYCALYEAGTNQPFARMISEGPSSDNLIAWATRLRSAHVNVWINPVKATSAGALAAIALHEFELHVLPFYEFFNRLSTLAYHAELKNSRQAADTLRDLVTDVNDGVYSATRQHASAALRANQALSVFGLAAQRVKARMTDEEDEPEIDPGSYEYRAIMTTRNDITQSFEDLDAVKHAYAGKLGALVTAHGKKAVDFVVAEFETD